MAGQLEPTWGEEDYPVLLAAVRLLDQSGPGVPAAEVKESAGLPSESVVRALRRLEPEYLKVSWVSTSGPPTINFAVVLAATGAARRVVGQWPDPDTIAQEVVSELRRLADASPEGKAHPLKALFLGGAEAGASLVGTTIATVIARMTGLG